MGIGSAFRVAAILLSGLVGAQAPVSASDEPADQVTMAAVAEQMLPVFLRPDSASLMWAIMSPGESVTIAARTEDGWLGFDPGVAQAGNSGSFRYRWLAPGGACSLEGDPARLQVVWGPSADVPYVMTFEPVPIYLEPDSTSTIVDILPGTSAAAIELAVTGWYEVDPSDGPSPSTMPGWVHADDVSINGEVPATTVLEDN